MPLAQHKKLRFIHLALAGNLIADYTLKIDNTSTIKNVNEDLYSFYPNLASTLIQIQLIERIDELTIYDISGKIVVTQKKLSFNETVDVSSMTSVLFIMHARIGNKVYVKKLSIHQFQRIENLDVENGN